MQISLGFKGISVGTVTEAAEMLMLTSADEGKPDFSDTQPHVDSFTNRNMNLMKHIKIQAQQKKVCFC